MCFTTALLDNSEYKHSLTFRVQRYVVNGTHARIANPPNSAQLEGTLYQSLNLDPGSCTVGNAAKDRQTHRHTHTHTHTHTFRVVYDSREMSPNLASRVG